MLQDQRIWILVGGHSGAIQQVPVYHACVERFGRAQVALLGISQCRGALDSTLGELGAWLDAELEIQRPELSLVEASMQTLSWMSALLSAHRPDWLVVQGDSPVMAMAAWAAYLLEIRVAQSDAKPHSPNPIHRKLITQVSTLHLTPTPEARDALGREGIDLARARITGDPGIDTLRIALARPVPTRVAELDRKLEARRLRPVLLALDESANLCDEAERWIEALARFLRDRPDVALIHPAHPDTRARAIVERHLASLSRAEILESVGYAEACHLLRRCRFVVTDSAAVQANAATLCVPAIASLSGAGSREILEALELAYRQEPSGIWNPVFGDGWAGKRIAEALAEMPGPLTAQAA